MSANPLRFALLAAALPALALAAGEGAAPAAKPAAGAAQTTSADAAKPKAAAPGLDTSKLPDELYATFVTTAGKIGVKLTPKEKPVLVRNFVELATGKKEWTDPRTGQKSSKPLYDNTQFHRVIPSFMIQGGDPLGVGVGGPGYKLPDEIDPGERPFDRPCQLAYANSGPDTNGSQFFITEVPTPHLNPQKCQHDNPTAQGVCGYVRIGEGVCGCDLVGKIARAGNSKTTLNRVIITRSKPSCG